MNLRWISNPTRNRRCIVLASLALAYRFAIEWSTCSVEMSGQVAKWYVLSLNTTNVKLLTQQVALSYRYMCSSIHIAILRHTRTQSQTPSTRHAWTFVKWKKQNENNWNDSFQLDYWWIQSTIVNLSNRSLSAKHLKIDSIERFPSFTVVTQVFAIGWTLDLRLWYRANPKRNVIVILFVFPFSISTPIAIRGKMLSVDDVIVPRHTTHDSHNTSVLCLLLLTDAWMCVFEIRRTFIKPPWRIHLTEVEREGWMGHGQKVLASKNSRSFGSKNTSWFTTFTK